jgi:hypothetical protein
MVSCGCIKVTPHPLTIAAGETALVRLTADLTRRPPTQIGWPERKFSYEITPTRAGRDWRHQAGWAFRGVVKSRVTLDMTYLDLGDAPVYGLTGVTRTVRARTHVPAETLEATIDPKVAVAAVTRSARSPSEFDIAIEITPTLPVGRFETMLAVVVVTPEGERLPGISIPIKGEVRPEISPLPARLLLGTHRLGEEVASDIVLQNPTGCAYTIERLETDSLDVTAKVVAGADIKGVTVRVIQRIASEGEHKSALKAFLKKRDGTSSVVAMEVWYHGVRDLHSPLGK